MLDFEFTNTYVMCKAILSPTPIKEILRDLDNSAETVMLIFTQNYIAFYTVGELGKIKVKKYKFRGRFSIGPPRSELVVYTIRFVSPS